MIELKTKTTTRTVDGEKGMTILDTALRFNIDWGFSCSRGTCARCRCRIISGAEHLAQPTDEELDRLEPEELEAGYRLGCQAKLLGTGDVSTVHKPYF